MENSLFPPAAVASLVIEKYREYRRVADFLEDTQLVADIDAAIARIEASVSE